MKVQIRLFVAAVVATLLLAVPAPAHAGLFFDRYSGNDLARTTTLNYLATHKAFNLRVWVSGSIGGKKYSIKMYDKTGRRVWSASNQVDRTYYIGRNVTRLVIARNETGGTTRTNWQKR